MVIFFSSFQWLAPVISVLECFGCHCIISIIIQFQLNVTRYHDHACLSGLSRVFQLYCNNPHKHEKQTVPFFLFFVSLKSKTAGNNKGCHTNLEKLNQLCRDDHLRRWICFDARDWGRHYLWLLFDDAPDFPLILWPAVHHEWFQKAGHVAFGRSL